MQLKFLYLHPDKCRMCNLLTPWTILLKVDTLVFFPYPSHKFYEKRSLFYLKVTNNFIPKRFKTRIGAIICICYCIITAIYLKFICFCFLIFLWDLEDIFSLRTKEISAFLLTNCNLVANFCKKSFLTRDNVRTIMFSHYVWLFE